MKPIRNMLVFETDFGRKETSVSAMYGVVKSVDRNIEIIEATHELPPFDIYTASYRLWQAMEYWPAGTVFVSVVDPGVGTKRRACVALTEDGYYIVTPDNGSLTHVRRTHGIAAVREIDETINRRRGSEGTAVFHGRDLFGYCAARLTSGIITFEQVGPSYSPDEIVMLDIPSFHADEGRAEGFIEIDDPNFGNLFTNIPIQDMLDHGFSYGDAVHTVIKNKGSTVYEADLPLEPSFGAVSKGQPLLYNNELMKVSLSIAEGDFMHTYGVHYGKDWHISLTK